MIIHDFDSDGILINSNEQGGVIDLSYNEVTGKQNGIEIQSNAGKIDIDANSVTGENGVGIDISPDTTNGTGTSNTGKINIDNTGNVTGTSKGINIVGNDGMININADGISGSDGVIIEKSTADSDIDITAHTITGGVYLEDNLGKINIYGDNFSEGKGIYIKKNNTKGDFTLVSR